MLDAENGLSAVQLIDAAGSTPLYMQVGKALREAILARTLAADAALPPERDLASTFKVSRITVRKALDALEAEGLIDRKQGAGTFICASPGRRIEKSLSVITSFTEDMRARGRQPRSEWVAKVEGQVTPEEALSLRLSPGAGVYRLTRIRIADDLPMAIETAVVEKSCLPSIDVVAASLYEALDAYGNRPVRALQRLRAIALDPSRAEQLGVAPGSPALLIERHGFHQDGRSIEMTTSYYRGDAYDFLAELQR